MSALRFVDRTESTQDEVRGWAIAGRAHGDALVAAAQSAGRGRLGRRWEAAPGEALMMSVLLRPALPASRLPLLALAAGVALRDAVGPSFGLKWPNDLLAPDGRKVAGVLAEVEGTPAGVAVILGVGVNVGGAPPLDTATSLRAAGFAVTVEELAERLHGALLRRAAELERAPDALLDAWRAGSCTLGRPVRVGEVEGVAVALGADGSLIVERGGQRVPVRAGDVELLGGRWDPGA